MDFTLSKKHEMARTLFREFAEKEVKPLAQEVDETEEFPRATVEKMAKAGFMGIPIPKEYGGQGGDDYSGGQQGGYGGYGSGFGGFGGFGGGGFGVTYVGRDTTLDLRVAVKEFFPFGLAQGQNDKRKTIAAEKGSRKRGSQGRNAS